MIVLNVTRLIEIRIGSTNTRVNLDTAITTLMLIELAIK